MSFNELDSDLSRSTVDLDSLSSVTSSSSDEGKESASSNVSSWTVRHVEKFLNIHYERDYLESPLAVLQKIPSLEELSEEQMLYIDRIKAYLKFDASYKMYDETYNFYTGQDGLKRTLENNVVNLNQEPGEDELIKFKVSRFLKWLHRFMINVEAFRSQHQVYEGHLTQLLGSFAEMCCIESVEGSKSNQSVWKNLAGTKEVISKPDLRFYKSGLTDHRYFGDSEIVVSVIEVITSEKFKQRLENLSLFFNQSNSSEKSDGADKSQIELDLNERVLGQHAGELLLDLDKYRVKKTMFVDEDYTMTMPGMIMKGTQIFFTMLKMQRSHHRKLKYNAVLDQSTDRATIYYSRPLDLLVEEDRSLLVENFMRLNNI